MDVPHVQRPSVAKAGDAKKPDRVQPRDAESKKAEGGTATGAAASDTVSLSEKAKANARLLQHLREKFEELPDARQDKVEEARERIKEGALKMSSEEIIQNILDGNLFYEV